MRPYLTIIAFLMSGLSSLFYAQEPTVEVSIYELEDRIIQLDSIKDALEIADISFRIAERSILMMRDSAELPSMNDMVIKHYLNASHFYKVAEEIDRSIKVQADLGRFYMSTDYFSEADAIFDTLATTFRSSGDTIGLGYMNLEMADIALTNGKYDLAISLLDSVKQTFKTHRDSALRRMYNYSFSTITSEGDNKLFVDDSLWISLNRKTDTLDNANYFSALLNNNGIYYESNGHFDMALFYYLLGEKNAGYSAERQSESKVFLSNLYARMEDYQSALSKLRSYTYLNDSVVNARRMALLEGLTLDKANIEKQNRVADIRRDQRITEIRSRTSKLLSYGLGVAVLITLIGSYFIIRNYQNRLSANQIISTQNEEITKRRITELENNLKIETMHSMLSGQEAERERIAKDLHDSLGGLLSTVKLHFDAVQTKDEDVGEMESYQKANMLLDEACKEVRNISNNMQPGALLKLGIVAAVGDLINRIQSPRSPDIDFQHFGINGRLDNSMSLNIYRMVQELLYNSLKHAKAKEILVQLIQKEDEFMIMVEDDGVGFDNTEVKKGMGTENIASRVNYLKGDLSIHSMKGTGTTTLINIPMSG